MLTREWVNRPAVSSAMEAWLTLLRAVPGTRSSDASLANKHREARSVDTPTRKHSSGHWGLAAGTI